MKIFNSLTGKKETFKPKIKKEVSIYICGLTPYDDVHIGHARTFINFDVIVKFLRFIGYQVKYVRNITDVDDKIIHRAKEEGIPALDFSRKYIKKTILGCIKQNHLKSKFGMCVCFSKNQMKSCVG